MSNVADALSRMNEWEALRNRAKIMTRPRLHGYFNELARGTYRGYQWYVSHNDLGFRTGYVKVPKRHPWFLVEYDHIDADAHGGLTYSEKGPVGKIPKFSYQWWIGFDCGHAWDAPDPELISPNLMKMYELTKMETQGRIDILRTLSKDNVIRTQEYVESECVGLCVQAIEAMKNAS